MGLVLSAWDPALQRHVALKLMRPELAGEARDRLLAEARAVASMKHPNVIPVFDVGEASGRAFIAMELVEGVTLDRWRKLARPGLERILEVFVEAGRGLAAAHARGLVHRDVKPQNILVATDDRVLVTDFGLAVSSHDADQEAAGTPAYMAPEQRTGLATASSDQYAYALCLAEAVYGTLPHGHLPLAPNVPDWLVAVLRRALDPDPAERYPDLPALLEELEGGGGVNASAHVTTNAILLAGWTLLHAFWFVVLLWAALLVYRDPTIFDSPAQPDDSAYDVGREDTEDIESEPLTVSDGIVVALALYGAAWVCLGLLWAPLNAFGLWRRKAWARVSTLSYAGFTGATVLGLPYSAYAIYSLTRPKVVELLAHGRKRKAVGPVTRGQVHLTVNVLALLGMFLLHLGLLWLSVELVSFGAEDHSPDTPLLVVLGLWWNAIGAAWVLLTAWGLFKRRGWARWTGLSYAVFALLGGVGIPYGLYALVSLSLPDVRARLRAA